MTWDKPRIVAALRKLYRSKASMSYNAMARSHQALLSAAAYHFGSYRDAVARAGIDYQAVCRRPKWTKQRIIGIIKQARRKHRDLNWSAVTKRHDELGLAAFASLQPRLFGSWARALHAAGLDADHVAIYRTWDRNTVVFEIRARYQNQESLASGAVQQEDPALHAAAVRYFGSWAQAIRAAHFNPAKFRQRQSWTKRQVLDAIRSAAKRGAHLSDSSLRGQNPALHSAAIRHFGTFSAARRVAGVKWKRPGKPRALKARA